MRVRVLLVLLLLVAVRATATTLVPMSDADLVRTSAVVVMGTVRRIETLALHDGRLVTEVTVAVDAAVKGRLSSHRIVVTQPGGRVPGRLAWADGGPELARGERVVLFLQRTRDGRLRTNGMALGAYHVDGDRVAHRMAPRPDVRALTPFLSRLRRLAADEPARDERDGRIARHAGEVVERMVLEHFTLLGTPPGRWTTPTVTYRVANQEASLGATATATVVADALAAWSDVATSSLVLTKGTSTSPAASIAGGACDGSSRIQFNDPLGEIPNLVSCTGVLAVGGFCTTTGSSTVDGVTYERIDEGDVTMNNGVGACFGATGVAEVLTHELGHTIGLGHSSQNPGEPNALLADATMFFLAHFDGRGAALRSDDRAGITAMYPGPTAGAPDADDDGVPDDRDACPTTTGGLAVDGTGCACVDAGHVTCDDGDACTTDACNAAAGGCTHTAVSCDDVEPCTDDTCAAASGCAHAVVPDTDGDGFCDAIDDSDGDGVVDRADDCPATPAGSVSDAVGCACVDADHVDCDDGSACTSDACDAATGRCVATDMSCDDGDACSQDGCEPAIGCVHASAGDADGDGRCDPIDLCPRRAGDDDTDADGDGVGDACSCTSARPGRCIPARGKAVVRCLVEWRPEARPALQKGLPAAVVRCRDGDPSCDGDELSGQCTLRTQLCINNADPRFPVCVPFMTTALTVRSPRRARDAADVANLATLRDAIDLGAQTPDHCSAPLSLVVPTRGPRPGRKVISLQVTTQTGRAESVMRLVCLP